MLSNNPTATDTASHCFDDNTAVEFIDGVLSDIEVKRVEHHVARCKACRQLLAELGCSPSLVQFSPTLPQGTEAYIAVATGQQVGRFVVLSKIGQGGMGAVFAAYDPKLDRKVALKVLHSPDKPAGPGSNSQMRLLREAQAIAQLSHPNVISVYDVGTYQSEVYIAMEFVEGCTLTTWLNNWERPWKDVLDKFVQAGKALVDAHAAGLVHRDFKPDNVLVGKDERIRVMDFGLARWVYADGSADEAETIQKEWHNRDNALDRRLTKSGTVMGTPRYMAPEQFVGASADARSDQFSFCVALYEALYKQHPFEESTAEGLITSPDATQVRPPPAGTQVPAWLHKALLRGLSRDPHDRYASMGALLRTFAPVPSRPPRYPLAAPMAVAMVAVLSSVYLYQDRAAIEDSQQLIKVEKEELEEQIRRLKKKIEELTSQLRDTSKRLKELSQRPDEVRELQRQLAQTKVQLQDTLQDLEQTQIQLAEATRKLNTRPTKSVRPRLAGLRAGEVRRRVYDLYPDLDVCFREWREREGQDQPVFAVRMEIDSRGASSAIIRSAGLGDQVVRECVTGLLQTLRFPGSDGVTVVDLGFRNTVEQGLTVTADVKDVRPEAPDSD